MEGFPIVSVLDFPDIMLPEFVKKQIKNPPKGNDDYVRLLIDAVNDELGPPSVYRCYLDTILSDMIRYVRISLNVQGHKYWMEAGQLGLKATEPSSSSEKRGKDHSIKSSGCMFRVVFEAGDRSAILVHNLGELRSGKVADDLRDEDDMEYADVCVVVGVNTTLQEQPNSASTEECKPGAIYIISREGVCGDDNPTRQGMFMSDKHGHNIKFMDKVGGRFTFAKLADSIEDLLLRPADKPLVLTEMYGEMVSLVKMELKEAQAKETQAEGNH